MLSESVILAVRCFGGVCAAASGVRFPDLRTHSDDCEWPRELAMSITCIMGAPDVVLLTVKL